MTHVFHRRFVRSNNFGANSKVDGLSLRMRGCMTCLLVADETDVADESAVSDWIAHYPKHRASHYYKSQMCYKQLITIPDIYETGNEALRSIARLGICNRN